MDNGQYFEDAVSILYVPMESTLDLHANGCYTHANLKATYRLKTMDLRPEKEGSSELSGAIDKNRDKNVPTIIARVS